MLTDSSESSFSTNTKEEQKEPNVDAYSYKIEEFESYEGFFSLSTEEILKLVKNSNSTDMDLINRFIHEFKIKKGEEDAFLILKSINTEKASLNDCVKILSNFNGIPIFNTICKCHGFSMETIEDKSDSSDDKPISKEEIRKMEFKKKEHIACENNNFDYLQDIKYTDVCDGYGRTGLHYACLNGNFEMAHYLLTKCNADPDIPDNKLKTPLHYAAEKNNEKIVKYLIEKCKVNVNLKDKEKRTALHYACMNGNLNMAKYLIEVCKIANNTKDANKNNELMLACKNGNVQLVEYLFSKINYKYGAEYYIKTACENNNISLLKFIIKKTKGRIDYIELMFLRDIKVNSEMFKFLLLDCADKFHIRNKKNIDGVRKYIINFYFDEKFDNDAFLVTQDESIHLNDKSYEYLFISACKFGKLEIVKKLLEKYSTILVHEMDYLCRSCESGNYDLFKYLIEEKKFQIDEDDEDDIIYSAISGSNIEIFNYLMEKHIKKSHFKDLYLREALDKSNFYIIKYLIEKMNYQIDIESNMKAACLKGNLLFAKYLIERYPRVLIMEHDLLHFAVKSNNFDLIKYLIEECRLNINNQNKKRKTILHLSAKRGDLKLAKYLIEERHISLSVLDENNKLALNYAIQNDDISFAVYFIKKYRFIANGLNLDTVIEDAILLGNPILLSYMDKYKIIADNILKKHIACAASISNLTLVKWICGHIKKELDMYDISLPYNEKSGIIYACQYGNLPLAKFFCWSKRTLPYTEKNCNSPLIYACRYGNFKIVKYLVEEMNVDILEENENKKMALHFAKSEEIRKYLIYQRLFKKESELRDILLDKFCHIFYEYDDDSSTS